MRAVSKFALASGTRQSVTVTERGLVCNPAWHAWDLLVFHEAVLFRGRDPKTDRSLSGLSLLGFGRWWEAMPEYRGLLFT